MDLMTFMKELSEDPGKKEAFMRDAAGVLQNINLPEAHKQLLLANRWKEVRQVLGDGWDDITPVYAPFTFKLRDFLLVLLSDPKKLEEFRKHPERRAELMQDVELHAADKKLLMEGQWSQVRSRLEATALTDIPDLFSNKK